MGNKIPRITNNGRWTAWHNYGDINKGIDEFGEKQMMDKIADVLIDTKEETSLTEATRRASYMVDEAKKSRDGNKPGSVAYQNLKDRTDSSGAPVPA